jgi:6-pyruvoyltetrahydropterin/6-carboxytetrahydropterin synthase
MNLSELPILIRLRREIDAAHQLPWHQGKCHRLHGHRWKIEVALRGQAKALGDCEPMESDTGMVIDFSEVKGILDHILPDHLSLNDPVAAKIHGLSDPGDDAWQFAMENPTCENFARVLYEQLYPKMTNREIELVYVRVWETPHGDAQYPG